MGTIFEALRCRSFCYSKRIRGRLKTVRKQDYIKNSLISPLSSYSSTVKTLSSLPLTWIDFFVHKRGGDLTAAAWKTNIWALTVENSFGATFERTLPWSCFRSASSPIGFRIRMRVTSCRSPWAMAMTDPILANSAMPWHKCSGRSLFARGSLHHDLLNWTKLFGAWTVEIVSFFTWGTRKATSFPDKQLRNWRRLVKVKRPNDRVPIQFCNCLGFFVREASLMTLEAFSLP